jgi:hypothetical protein
MTLLVAILLCYVLLRDGVSFERPSTYTKTGVFDMTNSPALAQPLGQLVQPTDSPDILRVIAVGSLKAVNHHVMQMYQLGYAQPHEWSRPLPWGDSTEVMRILTKRFMGLEG